jgi:hypothetical protein
MTRQCFVVWHARALAVFHGPHEGIQSQWSIRAWYTQSGIHHRGIFRGDCVAQMCLNYRTPRCDYRPVLHHLTQYREPCPIISKLFAMACFPGPEPEINVLAKFTV